MGLHTEEVTSPTSLLLRAKNVLVRGTAKIMACPSQVVKGCLTNSSRRDKMYYLMASQVSIHHGEVGLLRSCGQEVTTETSTLTGFLSLPLLVPTHTYTHTLSNLSDSASHSQAGSGALC